MNLLNEDEISFARQDRYFIKNYGLTFEQLEKMPITTLALWLKLDEEEKKSLKQQLKQD
jgi:hypothetical protein